MTVLNRIAGAPISWGVCEVPGWGYQLAPERVLEEMSAIGLRATELGPEGFLPVDPVRLRELLERYDLQLVSGFVPLVLHRAHGWQRELAAFMTSADLLSELGCRVLVLSADTGEADYERSSKLDEDAWNRLERRLDQVIEIAGERGLVVAVHPHYGTVIERPEHVERVLQIPDVPLCLDTGHLLIGGTDPIDLAERAHARIVHVHLKDVAQHLGDAVREGQLDYSDAVRRGLYRPLGAGDVDVTTVVRTLEDNGYSGWYVLEQDAVLEKPPEKGWGPIEDARASLDFLRRVANEVESGISG